MSGRRTEIMDRDAQMYLAHKENIPHEAIAKKFGVSTATVGAGIRRAIQDSFRLSADEDRLVLSDQIDSLMFKLRRILTEQVYIVSVSGKVVVNPMTGEPLIDYGHQRQTIESLRKLMDQKSKLMGLNMPVRHRVEITDKMDDEIERLATELMMHGAGSVVEPETPVVVGGDGNGDDGGGSPF
jgi:hypothetical protein